MEIIAGLGTAIASGIGSVGTGLSSIGTTLGIGAEGLSVETALQGGSTALSALSSIAGGTSAKRQSRFEAEAAASTRRTRELAAQSNAVVDQAGLDFGQAGRDLAANVAKLNSEETVANLLQRMAETIGQTQVAFAAGGVDSSFGTPAHAAADIASRTNEDIARVRRDANLSGLPARLEGSLAFPDLIPSDPSGFVALARGNAASQSGFFSAAIKTLDFISDVSRRGGPTVRSRTSGGSRGPNDLRFAPGRP